MRFWILALLFLASPLQATETYYVGKHASDSDSNSCATAQTNADGSRKKTIKSGLSCVSAADGDTVIIKAGTYNEELSPRSTSQPNIPSGTNYTNALTIKGAVGETVIIQPAGTDYGPIYFGTGLNPIYVKFENLTLSALYVMQSPATGTTQNAFAGFGTSRIRFTNVIFRDSPNTSGIFLETNSSFNEFIGCRSTNNGWNDLYGMGMYIKGADNLFDGMTLDGNYAYGVQVFSNGVTAHRNIIRNSNVYNNGLTTTNGGSCGILVTSGTGNQVYNNVVRDHSTAGSGLKCGILVGSQNTVCTNCLVYNNTVVNNDGGYQLLIGTTSAQVQATGTIARNNVLVGTLRYADNGTGTTNSNQIESAAGAGFFRDLAADDYYPASGTAQMVNAGCNAGAASPTGCGTSALTFTTDFAGTVRGIGGTGTGTNFDIGAYEFASPPNSITLLVPSTNTPPISWLIGSSQTVTWDNNGTIGNVTITEDRSSPLDGTYETAIATNITNDETETITVGGSAGTRKMQICEADGSPCDTSDNTYEVTSASSPKTITMTQPATGSHFFPGQNVPAGWTSTGLSGSFNTYISYNAGVSYEPTAILTSAFDAPTVSWVATGPAGTTIRFKTCAQGADAAVCGETGNFKIGGTYLSIR